MMPWKKMILPAIVALAVPVMARADTAPTPAPAPAAAGCANGSYGAAGAAGFEGGRERHGCHLFQFLEETNQPPEFRPRGSLCHPFGGHLGGGHGMGGHGPGAGYGDGSQTAGHGLLQPPFQAAPWYLYWPYDAHFQLPAPINAPYYPPQAYGYPGAYNPYFGGSAPPGWQGIPAGYNPGTPAGTPPMALPGAPGPRITIPEPLIAPGAEKK
ncbi:MAG TPA: hypothetical protein VKS79_20795 [Gemmataceae bacterium]|nr:hypothetical protein [Gemmataceae bacterium]